MKESMMTFRGCINNNKRKVIEYLNENDFQSTSTIQRNYKGEEDIYQVRKALRELKNEGRIECQIRYVNSNYWRLKNTT